MIKTLLMLLLLAVSLTFCNLVTGYGPGTGSRQNDIAAGFIVFLPIVLILIFIIRKRGTDNDSQKVESDPEITSPLASAKSDDMLDGSNHSFSNIHKFEEQSDALEKPDEEKPHLSKNIYGGP